MDRSSIYIVSVDSQSTRGALIQELRKSSCVAFAEPNARIVARTNDPYYDDQWNMYNMGQFGGAIGADVDGPAGWGIFTGSPLVLLGMIDLGGIDASHPEFQGRVLHNAPEDQHATLVAGIAAATGNNGIGIAGMDWNCKLYVEGIGQDIPSTAGKIIEEVNAGVEIMNNSWGQMGGYSHVMASVFAYAYQMGVLSTNSMPEEGIESDFPGDYGQGILNVEAMNQYGGIPLYEECCETNKAYGDVIAPGGDTGLLHDFVPTTESGGGYAWASGTSIAAPHAAGLAGLLLGYSKAVLRPLYNDDIENVIKTSAKFNPSFDPPYTGQIDAGQALARLNYPYFLDHQVHVGGGPTEPSGTLVYVTFYGVPPFTDGVPMLMLRQAQVVEVPLPRQYDETPDAWGVGVETTGWPSNDDGRPLYGNNWCGIENIYPTTISVETYIYGECPGGIPCDPNTVARWYPAPPESVVFSWSVLGRMTATGVSEEMDTRRLGTLLTNPVRRSVEFWVGNQRDNVILRVFDINGRSVCKIGLVSDGNGVVRWDITELLSSGVYYYKLVVHGQALRGKMLVLR